MIIDHGRAVAAGTPQELKRRAGRSVIEVHVRDRQDLAKAAAALSGLDHGDPEVEETTRRVSIRVEAGTGLLRDALQALDVAGADVDDVSLRPPKLDEVFLALTGKALGDPTDRSPSEEATA